MADPSSEELLEQAQKLLSATNTISAEQKAYKYPYYRQHFAQEVLDTLDEVIQKRSPIVWGSRGSSVNTQYLKWNQAVRWMHDNTDKLPEHTLEKLALVTTKAKKGIGLEIAPRVAAFRGSKDIPWREDAVEFVHSAAAGENFRRIGVVVTPEDHQWVLNLIQPVADLFIVSVTVDSITIVKLA